MEEFVRNLLHISDLRVLTKKMVRKKYKEHLGLKDLDQDMKEKLHEVIYSLLDEIAKSQEGCSDIFDLPSTNIKTEEVDGNKENNSSKDSDTILSSTLNNNNRQKVFNNTDQKSVSEKTDDIVPSNGDVPDEGVKSDSQDAPSQQNIVKAIDEPIIMSPPKKRNPMRMDKSSKKGAQKKIIKFEEVMAAVQDSDATSGLDEPSDVSSGRFISESGESAYEAESETDLDKTITKSKLFTRKRNQPDFENINNNSLGEVTPIKKSVVNDNEFDDSPVIVKKFVKRNSLVSDSGSESDSGGLMIDLPASDLKSKTKKTQNIFTKGKTTNSKDVYTDVNRPETNIFPEADSAQIFSVSDSECDMVSNIKKSAKEDNFSCDNKSENSVVEILSSDSAFQNTILNTCESRTTTEASISPSMETKKGKAPAKKLLLKLKRIQNHSSDDNDYNYEISESNEEDRRPRIKKKNYKRSSGVTDTSDTTSEQQNVTSIVHSDSNCSGPCKRPRKNISPAIVNMSDDDVSDFELHTITVHRKVTKKITAPKKPAAKKRKTTTANLTPEDKRLKFLRQICNKLGLVLRNTRELAGCVTSADKVFRILELLEKAGMHGEPSMKKVADLKLKKELNELNEQNLALSQEAQSGRPKRLAQTKLAQRKQSPYVNDGIVNSDDD